MTLQRRTPLARKGATKRRKPAVTCASPRCKRRPSSGIVICRTHAIAECDRLARDRKRAEVRACARCGRADSLQWSHHISRRFLVIRWNPDNATMHCAACHTFLTHNPAAHVEWIRAYIGQARWGALYAAAYGDQSARFTASDLADWLFILNAEAA